MSFSPLATAVAPIAINIVVEPTSAHSPARDRPPMPRSVAVAIGIGMDHTVS